MKYDFQKTSDQVCHKLLYDHSVPEAVRKLKCGKADDPRHPLPGGG